VLKICSNTHATSPFPAACRARVRPRRRCLGGTLGTLDVVNSTNSVIQLPQVSTRNGNKEAEKEKERKIRKDPSTKKDDKGKGPWSPSKV
jgi:hypothetical protein